MGPGGGSLGDQAGHSVLSSFSVKHFFHSGVWALGVGPSLGTWESDNSQACQGAQEVGCWEQATPLDRTHCDLLPEAGPITKCPGHQLLLCASATHMNTCVSFLGTPSSLEDGGGQTEGCFCNYVGLGGTHSLVCGMRKYMDASEVLPDSNRVDRETNLEPCSM